MAVADTAAAPAAGGELRLYWNRLRLSTWVALVRRALRPSLLQSPVYALAMVRSEPVKPHLGILREGEQTVATVLAFERRALGRGLQAITMHRGPAWLLADPGPERHQAALAAIRQSWPRRLGRRMAVMPELADTPDHRKLITAAGFRRRRQPGYRTIFWDLAAGEAARWAALDQRWRNAARQARRRKVKTGAATDGTWLTELIQAYGADKRRRGYPGPTPEWAQRLGLTARESGDLLIVRATVRGETMAAGLFIRHGPAATYLVGWTTPEGRWRRANHAVLWRASEELAADGVASLDLGGINPPAAPGVTRFKRGMGGEEVLLAGTYT